eukprot:gnl/TRDRNA2_/TRDRNA2_198335_c0_seq1.p1 gnl/TRDRNA2_/TRDRNA2_198335_c0~~gnl/TRDRNA2_/TRDRNA2_198335_c0_seq1.p1  ORF type:complete len:339 (+),score=44.55 gnl/TRDRNA2_/TRDRNA2_198335_c0_seq1:129-1145(+)
MYAHRMLLRSLGSAGPMVRSGIRAKTTVVSAATAAGAKAPTGPPVRQRKNTPVCLPGTFTVPPPVRVPPHISRPSYADHPQGRPVLAEAYGEVKDAAAIAGMRKACRLAAQALAIVHDIAKEGVSTSAVDDAVCEFVISKGGYPVGINYYGFPRGLCSSPNEVALHGIPNTRPLESGDIVNFDISTYLDGFYGDCSAMVKVGDVDEDARRLVEETYKCLMGAIEVVGPGVKLNEVGRFCEEFGKARGFGVVKEYCGHFLGSELHMKPNVLHTLNDNALELKPGMTFTIEPILIEGGSAKLKKPEDDGWTILSANGGWSAQWEHSVLITEHGAEILTLP